MLVVIKMRIIIWFMPLPTRFLPGLYAGKSKVKYNSLVTMFSYIQSVTYMPGNNGIHDAAPLK